MSNNSQIAYSYDKLGRLTEVLFSNGSKSTYTYDDAGNRSSVVAVPSITPPPPPPLVAAGFSKKMNGDYKNNAMIVMLAGGELMGWGDNTTAVLANGLEVSTGTDSLPQLLLFDPFTTVPPSSATIVDWVFSNGSLFVVYSNGWVYTAGSNNYGELGHGDLVDRKSLKRIESLASAGIQITKVWASGGSSSTNAEGAVYYQDVNWNMYGCGLNTAGNLGLSSTTNVSTPTIIPGINHTSPSHVIDVALAQSAALVSCYMLMSDKTLMVAGYNVQGQLGLNSVTNQTSFVQASSTAGTVSTAVSISANGGGTAGCNALFVDQSGGVWACGYNAHGELGIAGNVTNQKLFTQISGLTNITKAELGGGLYGFGYAVDNANRLYTWGYNGQNNLFGATLPRRLYQLRPRPCPPVRFPKFFSLVVLQD